MKRRGFSIIELVVAILLVGLIMYFSFPKYSTRGIIYRDTVFSLETNLRKLNISAANQISNYLLRIEKEKYCIYKNKNVVSAYNIPKNIYILTTDNMIDFSLITRTGAPTKGKTIYIFDKINKNLSRITIMIGSGRVMTYKDDYFSNKLLIDSLVNKVR